MKLTVFGASGGVGRQVVRQAAEAGHEVSAVVRGPAELPPGVREIRLDVGEAEPAAVEAAVAGADAVLSGLGPRSRADARSRVATRTTAPVVRAMERVGVSRLVVISAAPVGTVAAPDLPHPPARDPGDDWLTGRVMYPLIKFVLRDVYADLAAMEALLRASTLDWTAVRPPQLIDRDLSGVYRVDAARNLPSGRRISRSDLAHLMLAAVQEDSYVHETVRIAY